MGTQTPSRPKQRPTDGSGTGIGRPWQIVVVNDDINTFDHVIALFTRVLPGVNSAAAESLAFTIHNSGRAIVWSGHREPGELYTEQLTDGGLRAMLEPSA